MQNWPMKEPCFSMQFIVLYLSMIDAVATPKNDWLKSGHILDQIISFSVDFWFFQKKIEKFWFWAKLPNLQTLCVPK